MFFTNLVPLLSTCKSLNIVMEKSEDGKVMLSIKPEYKDKDDKAKLIPIVMSALPADLDKGFAEQMGLVNQQSGIFSNISAFLKQAKQVENTVNPANAENKKADTGKKAGKPEPENKTKPGEAKESKKGAEVTLPSDLFDQGNVDTDQQTKTQTEEQSVQTPAPKPEPKPEVPVVQTAPVQQPTTTASKPAVTTGQDDIF